MEAFQDREFWEDFLNVYRSFPCLWNAKSKEYSDKSLRKEAYSRLVSQCRDRFPKANKDFVTKKIHSFRCSFRREQKKVAESEKCGDSHVPNLWYYGILSFIANADDTNTRMHSGKLKKRKLSVDPLKNERVVEEICDDETLQDQYVEYTSLADSPQESVSSVEDIKPVRRRIENKMIEYSIKNSKNICPSPESKTDDEFDVAGKKIAFDLRIMSSHQRVFAEKIFSDVIYFAKLGKLSESSTFYVRKSPA